MTKFKFCYLFIITGLALTQETPLPNHRNVELKLMIDDGENMILSYADANLMMRNKYFRIKDRLNSHRWQGYQGNIRVSEPKFFEIAGFIAEAKLAGRYQTIRQSVFWTGTGMSFLGILITITGAKKNNNRWHFPAAGVGLLVTGISLDVLWYFAPPNHHPLSKALAAANQYNLRE